MTGSLLLFVVLAALIFFSGKKLSEYGDMIARHMGLGRAWIGLVLMASVTSLPELSVGISSSALAGSADLALGDVMGSCVFNLFILSMLDVFVRGEPLLFKASPSHMLAAALSIILVALVGMGLFLPTNITIIKWIGLSSILFIVVYFISMRLIYFYEAKLLLAQVAKEAEPVPPISFKRAVWLYVINAGVVIGAALFLPGLAQNIATASGWGESFVGTFFLAASTSLPEVAVSYSAIRMGAVDLAVGNLIGSNLFNILILSVDDMFYNKGPLLKDASDSNLVSVFSVIMMTAVVIASLAYRRPRKSFLMAWDSLIISGIYIGNLVLLYYLQGRI
jgi:cation:H+ antiporter